MFTTYTRFNRIALFVSIVVILACLVMVDNASASEIGYPAKQNYDATVIRPDITAYATRPNACRTYNIGGYDATDGVSCEQGEQVKKEKESDTALLEVVPVDDSSTTVVIVPNENDAPVIEIDVPEDNTDMPLDDAGNDSNDDTEHTDNGNHYGNDKPDNNSNDEKNKHDGEQTKEDHHDNNGNGKNKEK